MMINKEFLKTLTILYVEDDEEIREEYLNSLNNLFKEVITAHDGQDAYNKITAMHDNKEPLDVIISDINMPEISGMELLTKVKEINKNIPFILTTAHQDTNILLQALKEGVSDYFIKPVNFEELLIKIQKLCEEKEKEKEINSYEKEIKEYLEVINKVALVYIFDAEGKLIYVNDFLKELIKCHEDELLDQNYAVIFHPDMSKNIITKQWEVLQEAKKWQGKIKYITKSSAIFYTNATIMPVKNKANDEITKYISVNFLTTKEENERREYKRKVLYNLQETKRVYKVAQEKINYLMQILEQFQGYDEKQNELNKIKKINHDYYKEIQQLEQKISNIRTRFEQLTYGVNSKISKISIATSEMKSYEEKASKKIIRVTDEIKLREQFIVRIKSEIEIKAKKIEDLEDVMKHRQNQIEEKKS